MHTITGSLSATRRWHEVDGLRGICALAVMLFHYVFRAGPIIPADRNTLIFEIPGFPDRLIGEIWVYVFFMISGFVISFSLERCRTPIEFIVSRASRLYPVYWAATLLTAATWALSPPMNWNVDWVMVIGNLTMFQEFVRIGHVNGVYWSLTAELSFYAVMLGVFWAGLWRRLETITALWLGASIVFGVACSMFDPRNVPVPTVVATAFNLFLAPYFCTGIALHLIASSGWSRLRVAILVACVVGYFAHLPPVVATTVSVALGLWLLIIAGRAGALAWRPFRFLGEISYALYLSHLVLGYHVLALWPDTAMIVRVGAAAAVSLLLAAALTYAIERPALAFVRQAYANRHRGRSALSP